MTHHISFRSGVHAVERSTDFLSVGDDHVFQGFLSASLFVIIDTAVLLRQPMQETEYISWGNNHTFMQMKTTIISLLYTTANLRKYKPDNGQLQEAYFKNVSSVETFYLECDSPHLQPPSSLCASSSFVLHVQHRFLFFWIGLSTGRNTSPLSSSSFS